MIIYCKYLFEYLCERDIFAEITTMWGLSKKNIANPLKHFYGVHVVNLLYLLCKNVIAPGWCDGDDFQSFLVWHSWRDVCQTCIVKDIWWFFWKITEKKKRDILEVFSAFCRERPLKAGVAVRLHIRNGTWYEILFLPPCKIVIVQNACFLKCPYIWSFDI